MNDSLQQALIGDPVKIKLGGIERVLAFPMEAVILYKRETAALDRARAAGRPKMTRELLRNLRNTRKELLREANALRPKKAGPKNAAKWEPEKWEDFQELLAEATTIKIQLDEDAALSGSGGDSLYDMYNWEKIGAQRDPERLILALWVGMHVFRDQKPTATTESPLDGRQVAEWPGPAVRRYVPTLSKEQLGEMVNLGNGDRLTDEIGTALSTYFVAQLETPDIPEVPENADPNPRPPATPAE